MASSAVRRPGREKAARVVDIVRDWAETEPDRVCLTFYGPSDRIERVTYGRLLASASAYADGFVRRGLPPESMIVLLAPSVSDFVSGLLGAQLASLVAVPAPPLEPLGGKDRYWNRLLDIVRRTSAKALLTSTPESPTEDVAAALASEGVSLMTSTSVVPVDAVHAARPEQTRFSYCQFTSGSGGRAKGVLLTHENVLANIRARAAAFDVGDADVAVSWLPFSHDMGLLGYVLFPLVTGMPCHIMSPQAFLTNPRAWLALLTGVRGTLSGAPNSAYGLCARRIQDSDLEGLDLSSWRAAFNGAEPVTFDAVEAFTRRFEPVGFKRSALIPVYGLAENTLSVAGRRPGTGARFEAISREVLEDENQAVLASADEPRLAIASVGSPLPGQEVAILDASGMRCPERQIGEISVRGASVMEGYLPGTEGDAGVRPDGWLLTGDLGYQADGEVFIVGRKKDLIIRAGRKYYPQDLEDAAGRVPGVRTGRVAAFSVPAPERERVVVVAERRAGSETDPHALRCEIDHAVFAAVRFRPDDVVLVSAQTLPLTTSGKMMRPAARRAYLEGRYAAP
ncbi:MAG TPA: fatty acyl-AMP ligase [Methylomirabilota bacterium]|jgi:acyl-CoA synthetase (AMP-forming)/AMP-acid ligase II